MKNAFTHSGRLKSILLLFICISGSVQVFGQSNQGKLTKKDYDQAVKFLHFHVARYVDHGSVRPHWLENGRFWFRDWSEKDGIRFILVNPDKKIRKPAFNQKKLAQSLSRVTGHTYQAERLPFSSFKYTDHGASIIFDADGEKWKCNLKDYSCTTVDHKKNKKDAASPGRTEIISPNRKLAAFIKDYNLWVRNLATDEEVQLTTNGIKNFGYATDNASWRHTDKPIIRWSPDSKKIATFRQDMRKVGYMYLINTQVGEPKLEKWKYAYPGDTDIMMIHRVIIDVPHRKVIPLDIPADPRRSTQMDDITNNGHLADVQWSPDGSKLAFVSTSRYHTTEKVRIADAETGEVREVFAEKTPTQFSSGYGGVNWRYLPKSRQFIWFSQRDNWGHLYLYNAKTGALEHKITAGNYTVGKIVKLDRDKGVIYFIAYGLDKENPYFAKLCRIKFNGKGFKILTPESGNHKITFSPSKAYFLDSYSKPDVPTVTVLKDLKGKVLVKVSKTDISRLKAQGWKAPVPFKVKAADGLTNIYGLMYTPTDLDPNKKYPIIDYIYPGPQAGSVTNWSFTPARRDNQALSELGFIVVEVVGTGNPRRTKTFQDASYGNMAINTLPDQIAAIRQLAQRHSYMDTSRIGIWGHSGGGFATADALFNYPDFFDVGVAESGNHDNRNYEADWGDRFNGNISNSAYEAQANQNYAKNLKGHLMLVVGLMDNNVPPQNTLLVVQALEEANKTFDLIVYPNARHGYGKFYYYQMRRRWDYFVKYLLDKKTPENYQIR